MKAALRDQGRFFIIIQKAHRQCNSAPFKPQLIKD
jgi:hypothetical protein